MKAVFLLDKEFKQDSVMPRDIRNLVGSLVADEVIKNKLMNKDKNNTEQSRFIYPKPRPKSFEILNYTNDVKEMIALEQSLVGKEITIGDNKVKIEKCLWKEEEYEMPKKELSLYKTRTPIIMSINDVEHKMIYAARREGGLEALLIKRIVGITKLQMKEFFDYNLEFDDLDIKILNWNIVTITPNKKERPDKYVQGMYCEFVSNYKLPRFLGYQSGLGYGEIYNTNFGEKNFANGGKK